MADLLVITIFGLWPLFFIAIMLFPETMEITEDKLIISGGLRRNPKMIYWRDIQEIGIFGQRSDFWNISMLQYRYYLPSPKPDLADSTSTRRLARGTLPMHLDKDLDNLLAELEFYRAQAATQPAPPKDPQISE